MSRLSSDTSHKEGSRSPRGSTLIQNRVGVLPQDWQSKPRGLCITKELGHCLAIGSSPALQSPRTPSAGSDSCMHQSGTDLESRLSQHSLDPNFRKVW